MRSFFVMILLVAVSPFAKADECETAIDQATMNACADESFKKADAALNAVYKKLQSRKLDDEEAQKRLVDAERAWVAFRDAECSFDAADNLGGSLYPAVYAECLERITRARIEQLERYLRCEEGEAACSEPEK